MAHLAGEIILADDINKELLAGTVVARHSRLTASSATASATGIGVILLSVPVITGRAYEVNVLACHLNSTVQTDNCFGKVTMTTDGSTPTASSTIMRGALSYTHGNATGAVPVGAVWTSTITGTLKLLLCVGRESGTGNASMDGPGDGNRAIDLVVTDKGVDPGSTGTNV